MYFPGLLEIAIRPLSVNTMLHVILSKNEEENAPTLAVRSLAGRR